MIRNYLLTSFRNIKNNKGYVFINISGLSVGMACFIFILLWVYDELGYDKFHININELYRVVDHEQYSNGEEFRFAVNAPALAQALQEKFPEFKEVSRYSPSRDKVIEYGDKRFTEQGLSFADLSFFKLFSFPFIKGNEEKALSDPYSIVITEDMSEKYFGNNDPIGKTLRVDNKVDFHVTGVLENIPSNSHMHFDFIVPLRRLEI